MTNQTPQINLNKIDTGYYEVTPTPGLARPGTKREQPEVTRYPLGAAGGGKGKKTKMKFIDWYTGEIFSEEMMGRYRKFYYSLQNLWQWERAGDTIYLK